MKINLSIHQKIILKQVREMAEWIGVETRNKYAIEDAMGNTIGFAAEQGKGVFHLLFRQFFGHWRTFEIAVFSPQRNIILTAKHPFRWIWQRLEVKNEQQQLIGVIQQKFSIFSKKFHVLDAREQIIMKVSSPMWKIWSFTFTRNGHGSSNLILGKITKKWSGLFSEAFTDRDNFQIEFSDQSLSEEYRQLMLAAALFVDLNYFETKQ